MSENGPTTSSDSLIRSELLFLIARFLSNSSCKQAADVLLQELQSQELIPKGFDWEGNERTRTYDQLLRMNQHVGPDYLLQIVQRAGPLLDQIIPASTKGVQSLLATGSLSLLRTPESVKKNRWKLSHQMALQNGCPRVMPKHFLQPPIVQSLHARRAVGAGMTSGNIPLCLYNQMSMYDVKVGHLLPVYCAIYDRTGQYIFTGADDALVKIWRASSGRLLATLRGHSAEISDIAVNYENTLLATGSNDKVVRVWCLRTKGPVAVLQGHTGTITTVQFSPQCKGDTRILMSTGADGCVCFWLWNVVNNCFNNKPKKFVERSHAGAKMLCSSFSPGGTFVATGSSDHVIRVYFLYASEPTKICELEAHGDTVGSVCYSNVSNRFVSGSDDGTARVWRYERQEWKATVLNIATTLNKDGTEVTPPEPSNPSDRLRVTMVSWNVDDSLIVTAVSDFTIKVWDSRSAKLLHVLKAHEYEVYVLDASPVDRRVLLSAGHDGNIILWDIIAGVKIKSFFNYIQGQGHIAVFDCKFTPDGQSVIASDSYGQLLFFGFGVNEKIKKVPQEVFFHTDYRPLVRDANNFVLDEQTQQPPHLMPPPFLVNIDGNPYPMDLQRLVPGRERMTDTQLVPHLVINEDGDSEVIGDQDNPAQQDAAAEPVNPAQPGAAQHGQNPNQQQAQASGQAQAPVGLHQQDHDYSRNQNEHDRGRNDGRQNSSDSDEDTEDEDNIGLGRDNRHARLSIDEMIRQLQHEQDERILAEGGELPLASPPLPAVAVDARGDRSRSLEGRVGMRRTGELEGVRQSLGNMQQRVTSSDLAAISKRVVVKPLNAAELKTFEAKRIALAEDEIQKFMLERKKKQSVPNTPSTLFGNMSRGKQPIKSEDRKKNNKQEQAIRNRLTARALYDTEEEEDLETEQSDQHSDDSSYSDWTMEGSSNLQPPNRRSQRKPKRRRVSTTDDEDEDEEVEMEIEYDDDDDDDDDNGGDDDNDEEYKVYLKRPKKAAEKPEETKDEEKKKVLPATAKSKKAKKPSKPKKIMSRRKKTAVGQPRKPEINKKNLPAIKELKEEFMPPEWLTGTIPRKTPFVPQMGDEVMYFRQGHELYLQAVEKHKSYEISSNICLPWQKNPHLREMELVKIVGIRYEVKPPRLCSLKLAYINADTGKMSGGSFSIRYHDMPDVIDFLVLRQHYDISYRRRWKPGDRFRSMIDDQWWMGKIESQSPLNMIFPDSMFQCFFVRWDNGECERLSPWDMEPVNENLLPSSVGGGVPVDPEELKGMLYTPKPNEWSSAGREAETERILHGIEAVMEHSAAEPFNAPVDLNAFPVYAMIIEYPIDLSTIKARLDNGYYRRINALQWDVRHIESNAKKFNEDGTPISRSAGIVTDTLLKFISDPACVDPMPILEQLSHGQQFSWGGRGDDDDSREDGPSSSTSKRKRGEEDGRNKRQRLQPQADPNEWKRQCSDLLALIMDCEDAGPFMAPVDPDHYPNYRSVIETPMDLGTVGTKLRSDQYVTPQDFAKDVHLIFHNSRKYNTNKRSRIYSMTLRLSAMFDERVQRILTSWRAVSKNKNSYPCCSRTSTTSASVATGRPSVSNTQGRELVSREPQPSGSRLGSALMTRSFTSSRAFEGRTRTTSSSRRSMLRPAEDSDSDNTEVEEEKEDETEAVGQDASSKGKYEEDDDDDTEIEEEHSEVPASFNKKKSTSSTSSVRSTNRSQQAPGHKHVSNGHASYRTRAKTGSLRPKRYISSDEEEEREIRKTVKRAPSYSSRDSSFQHDNEEEVEESTESSSGTETTDSDSSTSRQRKKLSRVVHRKRKTAATNIRKKVPKKHQESDSSSDDEEDSENDTEDSETDSESEELPQKVKPRNRAALDIEKQSSGKKLSSSGKRTTRNQGKRTFNYLEDSYDEYEDDPARVSVSSRGRIRKMTKRARANRLDE